MSKLVQDNFVCVQNRPRVSQLRMLESLSKGSKINRGSKKGDGNYYGNSFVQLARKVWDLG